MTKELAACLLTGLLLAAPRLAAQDTTTARADSNRNVILLDITVDPNVNERQVVFLQKGIVYRASFSQPGVILRVRSLKNKQLPFIVPLSYEPDASERSEIEIYPQSDGDIELTPVFNARGVPVTFRLWHDARASLRRNEPRDGKWAGGVEVSIGAHSVARVDGQTIGEAGPAYAVCLAFRNGPSILGMLNGCAFGLQVQSGHRTDNLGSVFFVQPRLRLFRAGRPDDRRGFEGGIVFHQGIAGGNPDRGLGLYVARDMHSGAQGQGWRAVVQVRHDWSRGTWQTGPLTRVEGRLGTWKGLVSFGYYR